MGKTRDTGNLIERKTISDVGYAILPTDKYVALITTTATHTFNLPLANSVAPGYEIIVGDESGSLSSSITLIISAAGGSSDLLNGVVSETIITPYAFRRYFSNGISKWTSDTTIVRLNTTQTLTNKTLNSPILTTGVKTSGSAPTIVAGPGAGTSPTVTVTGNDIAGLISITVGASPATSSIVATISFSVTLSSVPKAIILTPSSGATGTTARMYVDQASTTASQFIIRDGTTAPQTGLSAFYYFIIQ